MDSRAMLKDILGELVRAGSDCGMLMEANKRLSVKVADLEEENRALATRLIELHGKIEEQDERCAKAAPGPDIRVGLPPGLKDTAFDLAQSQTGGLRGKDKVIRDDGC